MLRQKINLTPFLCFCAAVLGLSAPLAGLAEEQILALESRIRIADDGSMEVLETIRVRAEGGQIRRGIYRDFPTDYRDSLGNRYRVGFELLGVARDGQAEPHHTERRKNGLRIYAGSADRLLDPGIYTYTLRYRTDRQLGFFATHDELYWNVTGNAWDFTIETARAEVMPPAKSLSIEGYTGGAGERGRSYRSGIAADGTAWIETTRPLAPGEGLTLVVTWAKGHVAAPTPVEEFGHLLGDNAGPAVGLVGLVALLALHLWLWRRYGRDPATGVIIPHYEPPAGFSPASMRFIRRMGYDHEGFAAALLNLAVKGRLRIARNGRDYELLRLEGSTEGLAPGEGVLLRELFRTGDRIRLEDENHGRISKALKAHKRSLENDYERLYFRTNSYWIVPGVLLSAAVAALAFVLTPDIGAGPETFGIVWLMFWTIGLVFIGRAVVHAWRTARSISRIGAAVLTTLVAVPFFAAEGAGALLIAEESSWAMIGLLAALVGTNLLFYQLLKAPTLAGRRLLDKIEGFKMYLEVAEKDELALKNPPRRTPELFERYLPHALALGVEQAWAEQFADEFAAFRTERGQDYRPQWYDGRWDSARPGRFTGSLASGLSSAIASSATPPGSSSGSGGGGSSGGGGGGGGGGGW